MNTNSTFSQRNQAVPLVVLLLLLIAALFASAQQAEPAPTGGADIAVGMAAQMATPWIVSQAQAHPWICTVLVILGAIRFFAKPAVALWHQFAAQSGDQRQVDAYDKATRSAWFRWVMFVIDWLGSIKPPPKAAVVGSRESGASKAGVVALILAIGLAGAGGGCKSPERTAYRTIGSISVTVDGAMNGWGDWVRAGRATTEDRLKVEKAYGSYEKAMRLAEAATLAAKAAPEGEQSYVTAIRAASESADDLIALVESFTNPKSQSTSVQPPNPK